jgi:cyclic pyranopterin phosphate synthase
MPEGIHLTSMSELLTFEEIVQVVRTAAELGIRHVKLTGGEPLLRRSLPTLVQMLKNIEGIEQVTLTTNGILLKEHLPALLKAGLDAVNISLDSTDRDTFRKITGFDQLDMVLAAIDAACASGIRTKINAVSLNLGEEAIWNLIDLAKDRPLDVRFIEMMPIGHGKDFPVYSHTKMLEQFRERYPDLTADKAMHGFGPAVYYHIPGYQGSIGLISAIHGKFCDKCNRIRLTSTGFLKGCLCYNTGADLREILRANEAEDEKRRHLTETMEAAIYAKPRAHCFESAGDVTERATMNEIGG